jgi:hypothetical protein
MFQFDSRTAQDACSRGHPSDSYPFLTSTWMTAMLTDITVVFLGSSKQTPPHFLGQFTIVPLLILSNITFTIIPPQPIAPSKCNLKLQCLPRCTQTLPAWMHDTVVYAFKVTIHLQNLSPVLRFQVSLHPTGVCV